MICANVHRRVYNIVHLTRKQTAVSVVVACQQVSTQDKNKPGTICHVHENGLVAGNSDNSSVGRLTLEE